MSSRANVVLPPPFKVADLARSQANLGPVSSLAIGSSPRRRWNTPPSSASLPQRSPRFSHRHSTGLKPIPRALPDVEDVCAFLRTIGLGQHSAAFRKNQVDGRILLRLKDDHLKRLGVHAYGERAKLRLAQENWFAQLQARHPQGGTTMSPGVLPSPRRLSGQRNDPNARLQDESLAALSAIPLLGWSGQHVMKWVGLIGLPSEAVEPVRAVLEEENIDGHELAIVNLDVLRYMMRPAALQSARWTVKVGSGAEHSVEQLLIDSRDSKLASEQQAELAAQASTAGLTVPKSWLRRWNSHTVGWGFLLERVQAAQEEGPPSLLEMPEESLVLKPGTVAFQSDDDVQRRRAESSERYGAILRGEHLQEERHKHAMHTTQMLSRAVRAAAYVRGNSNLKALFELYDTDKAGRIDADRFMRLVRTSGKISTRQLSDTDVLRLFSFLARDGKLTLGDFSDFLLS